jgi:thiamine-phosphate pyrophosphorylase
VAKDVEKKVYRIIDANFNRAKEGLRVCEDIFRFLFNDPGATQEYKKIRHRLTVIIGPLRLGKLLQSRDIIRDVGKVTVRAEARRRNSGDVFYANSQRVKESIRVLEEFGKLVDPGCASELKRLRYRFYALEKNIAKRYQRRLLM